MNEVLRQEKKYAVNIADGAVLRRHLEPVMHADAHNGPQGYGIRSLYFDTPDDQDFQDKIDGLELRRKIRLRTYSPRSDFAMLEMKQKEGPYQRKRSLRLSREDAQRLCRGDYRPLQAYEDPFAAECYGLMHSPSQGGGGVPQAGLCGPGKPHPDHPGQPDRGHGIRAGSVFRVPAHVPCDGSLSHGAGGQV